MSIWRLLRSTDLEKWPLTSLNHYGASPESVVARWSMLPLHLVPTPCAALWGGGHVHACWLTHNFGRPYMHNTYMVSTCIHTHTHSNSNSNTHSLTHTLTRTHTRTYIRVLANGSRSGCLIMIPPVIAIKVRLFQASSLRKNQFYRISCQVSTQIGNLFAIISVRKFELTKLWHEQLLFSLEYIGRITLVCISYEQ